MFVIPRKRGESIVIGDDIEVIIVDIRDDKVRIGVNVPADKPLHRGEIYQQLRRTQSASESSASSVGPVSSGD
jgi:carbon storage regulator